MRKPAVWALVAALVALVAPLSTPSAAAAPAPAPAQHWLRLSIGSMRPSVVTATSTNITLTGRITNISDRGIKQVTARLQLADSLASGADVRSALNPTATYGHSDTVFTPLIDSLAPGASTTFTVHAPLQGPDSLRVGHPGVYPLMINLQGVPDFSNAYRLVAGTMLLPVLAAPGGQPPEAGPAGGLTVLWPLVDQRPRVLGTSGHQTVLSDDTLATSLARGGRLFGLLDAVRQATASNQQLLSTLCFAVDPDLLDTVRAMSAGYLVRTGDGQTTSGTGAGVATRWLATLRDLTAGQCVLPLPYADADLTALTHADGGSLLRLALSDSTAVANELDASPLTNVAWPADDTLDTPTMTALAGQGVNTVLLDPGSVTPTAGTAPVSLAGFTGDAAPRVVPIDPVVNGAMAPRTDEPNVDDAGISAQDGLAATIYQTVFGGGGGKPVLIAPPRRWTPSETQATAFLAGTAEVLAGHYATPASLTDAVAASPAGAPARLNYPRHAALAEVDHSVVAHAVLSDGQQRDVQNAMNRDHTTPTPVLPTTLINPLRLDLLRAVSSAWRDGDTAGATGALAEADTQFRALTREVTVVQPSLPILLGSKDSKLPVTVSNGLPVDIAVRVDLTGDPGLPSGSKESVIPAGASITVFISTSVTRSGRISAYATVRTIGGTELGQQARIELVSSAYGTIIVIVTAIAFALLVLLSGRRIYRRVRASRLQEASKVADQEAVGALVAVGETADRRRSEQQEPDER
ncbi:MAG TPA: DUF6049 family protein [Pseudonocardiaceae bacterium]|nr:DUF6049 family protein [Pseudonocardiaceae bacterium]